MGSNLSSGLLAKQTGPGSMYAERPDKRPALPNIFNIKGHRIF